MSDTETQKEAPKKVTTAGGKVLQVKSWIDAKQLDKDLELKQIDLTSAMMSQASLYAHYGTMAAKASRQLDDLKMAQDLIESKVDRSVRDAAVKAGEKLTENSITKRIASHPRVQSIRRLVNKARQTAEAHKTALRSFEHRKDMIIQLGLYTREEMRGEVSINRRRQEEDNVAATQNRILARQAVKKSNNEDGEDV